MSHSIPASLSALNSHSIFIPPISSSSTEDDWELVDRPSEPLVGQKITRMAVRGKDLLVAVGRDVRMTSLANGEDWKLMDGVVGSYKVHEMHVARYSLYWTIDTLFRSSQLQHPTDGNQPFRSAASCRGEPSIDRSCLTKSWVCRER